MTGFRPINIEDKGVPSQVQGGFRPVNFEAQQTSPVGIEDKIKRRGTAIDHIREAYPEKDTVMGRAKGALTLFGTGFDMLESAVASPAVYLHRELSPENPWKANTPIGEIARLARGAGAEVIKGITGQKLSEIGDVYLEAGAPEPVAATAGFISAMLIPSAIIGGANKAMKGVYKATDAGILKAGKLLSKGADDAVVHLSKNLDKAYAPLNNIPADGNKVVDAISGLSDDVVKHIESVVGKITSIDMNIETVRAIKGVLGKLKRSAFGKSADIRATLETDKVNAAYGALKNLIQESVPKHLSKAGKNILRADDALTGAFRASEHIKNLIIDPHLLKPTKAGSAARKLITEGDVSTRVSLETLKKSGAAAKSQINKATIHLQSYNSIIARNKFINSAIKTAMFAGIVGSVGAKVARKVLGGLDMDSNSGAGDPQ